MIYYRLTKEQIEKMVKTNKNAMKLLNNEEIKTIEEKHCELNNKFSYVINNKIEIMFTETLGSTRRYNKLFVYKIK